MSRQNELRDLKGDKNENAFIYYRSLRDLFASVGD